ncbi:hypothetical protein BJ912DRAFT_1044042 [Pholiota molesta]|nr:hypothetical protein BJ912DRAFT_1044042 [Pholiota molesta]
MFIGRLLIHFQFGGSSDSGVPQRINRSAPRDRDDKWYYNVTTDNDTTKITSPISLDQQDSAADIHTRWTITEKIARQTKSSLNRVALGPPPPEGGEESQHALRSELKDGRARPSHSRERHRHNAPPPNHYGEFQDRLAPCPPARHEARRSLGLLERITRGVGFLIRRCSWLQLDPARTNRE